MPTLIINKPVIKLKNTLETLVSYFVGLLLHLNLLVDFLIPFAKLRHILVFLQGFRSHSSPPRSKYSPCFLKHASPKYIIIIKNLGFVCRVHLHGCNGVDALVVECRIATDRYRCNPQKCTRTGRHLWAEPDTILGRVSGARAGSYR